MELKFHHTCVIFCLIFVFVCVGAIESPQYTVVHSESDFEVRLYRETAWMSAPVRGISFEKATREGFHRLHQYVRGANTNASRMKMTAPILTTVVPKEQSSDYLVRFYIPSRLQESLPLPLPQLNLQVEKWGNNCIAIRKFSGFAKDNGISDEVGNLVASIAFLLPNPESQPSGAGIIFVRLFQYIQGANLNFSRIAMTAPVLTSIVPDAGPLHSSAYLIHLYLPFKYQSCPPLPLPELHLQSDNWASHCVAIRKFSGFARDSNIVEEAGKLAVSLSRSPWANATASGGKYAYSIAQYNSPFRIIGRVNEVWVNIDGSIAEDCRSTALEIL